MSKITGGKFANGAFTAALQYIVNEGTKAQQESGKSFGEWAKEKISGFRELFTGSRANFREPLTAEHAMRDACVNNTRYQACLIGVDMIEETIGLDNVTLPSGAGMALERVRELTKDVYCINVAICNIQGYGDTPPPYFPLFEDRLWINERQHRLNKGLPNSNWWKTDKND